MKFTTAAVMVAAVAACTGRGPRGTGRDRWEDEPAAWRVG
jgi:hypothetical protein